MESGSYKQQTIPHQCIQNNSHMFQLLASKPKDGCKPDKMNGFIFHQTCHGEMQIAD